MSLNLRRRRRPVPRIPIVSLIDIMVVLLIFFVATTTFKKKKTQMQITLPQSKGMGATVQENTVRTSLTITKGNEIFLDGEPVQVDALAASLTSLKAAQPGLKLELEADTASALGVLVKVWDALKAAGIPINDVPARIQRK